MYTETVEYLGKRFDVDFEVIQDHNGDDDIQIESIRIEGTEILDFLECVHVCRQVLGGTPALDSVVDAIKELVESAHAVTERINAIDNYEDGDLDD